MLAQKLINKIKKKKITVGVIGLGYVGLPLSILFAKKKIKVIGFDVDQKKLKKIKKNQSYIKRIKPSDLRILNKSSEFTNKFEKINFCDVIVICVPTPLKDNGDPDLSYIQNVKTSIKNFLKEGQVLILESTSYPGTTREILVHSMKKNLQLGKNFFIGFSSERINPGFNERTIYNVPKVVSGYSQNCLKIISKFYGLFFKKIVKAKSLEIAEFSKLLENIYRSVNIGFINEMKIIADKMGLDIFEIIKVARTKPFGFRPFHPGPGVGGHCIPIDPNYLYWKAKKEGVDAKFIKLSFKTNNNVIKFIISKILKTILIKKLKKNKTKILILGMAYKPNIEDSRESGSIKLLNQLLNNNIQNVDWHDSYIDSEIVINKFKYKKKSTKINSNKLKLYDIVVLMTDHNYFDYDMILKNSKLIIDCRGRYLISNKVIRA